MRADIQSKGMWVHRLAIRLFTVVLAVLFFWLLRFLVQDIQTIPGPDFASIEAKYVHQDLLEKQAALDKQIADLTRQIENQKEKQRVVGDSSRNLQQTINQLLELQKLGIQKNLPFSDTDQANFTSSLNLFLENQRKYQELSQTESEMLDQKQRHGAGPSAAGPGNRPATPTGQGRIRAADLATPLETRVPAVGHVAAHSGGRRRGHRPQALQHLLPVVSGVWRGHAGQSGPRDPRVFPHAVLQVHSDPLTPAGRGGTLDLLHPHHRLPKMQWLVKQYREAYERFLCPVCEYPIRTGPRRFLFWTRRTVNKIVVPMDRGDQEEVYTCPSCGSNLFENCPACHKVRHTLLPHCAHCGAEKAVPER